ncbi:MAG: TIGR04150 pseudo-rSAM protein [Bacteroidales bacterium]|nr:TIGR04150 pseudo-rSAM protein [Bacteroidales bacterium]
MKDSSPWLFLEPYVQLLRRDDSLLVYNTISKAVLEIDLTGSLSELADELTNPENGYVVPLSMDQLQDADIQEFVNQLRGYFMGDLLDPSWSAGKPVNLMPEPLVKHGLMPPASKGSVMNTGLEVRNYLQEITLYLNTGPDAGESPLAEAGFQFTYPDLFSEKALEMHINLFRALVDDVNQYTPTLIHLTGKNLLEYPALEQAISHLTSSPFQKKYHILARQWNRRIIPVILAQKNTSMAVYITFPVPSDVIASFLTDLPDAKLLKKIEFNLIVSSQEELVMALKIADDLELTNVYFKPLFTGENLDFFRENVFVSKEEILVAQPDQKQVFSRNSINENDFGKLSILPGGEVFANLNDPSIGNATTHSLVDLVSEELRNGVSWQRSRKIVAPCSGCLYQFLCPPISSYEVFMKRYNFCNVYPNGEEL